MLRWNVFFMIGDIIHQKLVSVSTNTVASLEDEMLEWELRGMDYSVEIKEISNTIKIGV